MRRVLVGLLGGICVACGSSPSPSATASPQVIARVGSTSITADLFQLRLQHTLTAVGQAGGPTDNAAMTSRVRAGVLRSLLIDAVTAQQAAARGVAATPAEIQASIDADVAAAGGATQLQAQLAAVGESMDQLRDEIRSNLNGQQLEDLFARQRAGEVEQKLQAGASMASLAAGYSDDTATAATGGELGALARSTISGGDASFATAVFGLSVGHYTTTPIRDSQGYDIVLLEAATATTVTLRHIIIAAPQPYSLKAQPTWFTASIFEQLATDCAAGQIAVYISNVGDNPCAAASSGATPTPSGGAAAGSSPTP